MSDYEIVRKAPSVDDYMRLRAETGMSTRSRQAAEKALPNTLFAVCVMIREELVGMGRVIGDGGSFFIVVDIAVTPKHQKKGLGNAIMAELMSWIHANAPSTSIVNLFADGTAHQLYEKFGFKLTAPESLGMVLRIT